MQATEKELRTTQSALYRDQPVRVVVGKGFSTPEERLARLLEIQRLSPNHPALILMRGSPPTSVVIRDLRFLP